MLQSSVLIMKFEDFLSCYEMWKASRKIRDENLLVKKPQASETPSVNLNGNCMFLVRTVQSMG